MGNQEVKTTAKPTPFNACLERLSQQFYLSKFIQDLCPCNSFEDWLLSDAIGMGVFALILFPADSDKTTESYFLREGFILRI